MELVEPFLLVLGVAAGLVALVLVGIKASGLVVHIQIPNNRLGRTIERGIYILLLCLGVCFLSNWWELGLILLAAILFLCLAALLLLVFSPRKVVVLHQVQPVRPWKTSEVAVYTLLICAGLVFAGGRAGLDLLLLSGLTVGFVTIVFGIAVMVRRRVSITRRLTLEGTRARTAGALCVIVGCAVLVCGWTMGRYFLRDG